MIKICKVKEACLDEVCSRNYAYPKHVREKISKVIFCKKSGTIYIDIEDPDGKVYYFWHQTLEEINLEDLAQNERAKIFKFLMQNNGGL